MNMYVKVVHDKIRNHFCDKCDYKAFRKSELRNHIKTVHDKIKDFECDQCPAAFSLKSTKKILFMIKIKVFNAINVSLLLLIKVLCLFM